MEYITDKLVSELNDRVGDEQYKKRDAIKSNWDVCKTPSNNCCGNIRASFSKKTNKAILKDLGFGDKNYRASYDQISSALALYRSISLFECGLDSSICDFYKLNWSIAIKHKKTGVELHLGEWKGGFQIFTPFMSYEDIPKEYERAVCELLTFLVSPDMPIGYDGTRAGQVA